MLMLLYCHYPLLFLFFFFFQAEDGIRDAMVTGVQTCALPIWQHPESSRSHQRFTAIWSYTPPSAKWVLLAASQPPRAPSTVKVFTGGKRLAHFFSTAGSRGRKWCLAMISWPSGENRNSR